MKDNSNQNSTESSSDNIPAWYVVPITGVGLQTVSTATTTSSLAGLSGRFIGGCLFAAVFALGWRSYIGPRSLGMSKYGWSLAALVSFPAAIFGGYVIAYPVTGVIFAFFATLARMLKVYFATIKKKIES